MAALVSQETTEHPFSKSAIWPHLYINVCILQVTFTSDAGWASRWKLIFTYCQTPQIASKDSLGKNQRQFQLKLSEGNLQQTLSPSGNSDTVISLCHLTSGGSLAPRWRSPNQIANPHWLRQKWCQGRRSPGHCLIWSKHCNACFLGYFMTCLKNDFVWQGSPLMYEMLPQDFSTSTHTTFSHTQSCTNSGRIIELLVLSRSWIRGTAPGPKAC